MAHSDRVTNALWMLEALTVAPGHRLSAAEMRRALACTDEELDGYLDLLSTLADRQGGARAIAYRQGDSIVLEGDAARMRPLRLTAGESMALAHVIHALELDPNLSERLERALIAPGIEAGNQQPLLATARTYGPFYQELSEAIEDGVRCRILYRAQTDTQPAPRLIDPLAFEAFDDYAYLVAWNVEKDAERRYRLDRISDVKLADDSIGRREPSDLTVEDHLAQTGTIVTVECPASSDDFSSWSGVVDVSPSPQDPCRLRVAVRVSTVSWLFDQVLAAGGDMKIVEPAAWREQLLRYAQELSQGNATP